MEERSSSSSSTPAGHLLAAVLLRTSKRGQAGQLARRPLRTPLSHVCSSLSVSGYAFVLGGLCSRSQWEDPPSSHQACAGCSCGDDGCESHVQSGNGFLYSISATLEREMMYDGEVEREDRKSAEGKREL